uniref:AT-rich interactive domain-containing protein 3B isoform X1 n=1 Tax=Halichoerus grypus TaxID=9711 RepID=UPI0016596F08|nr:AT-rich interactive domain-containing protein 3B isoform X1 [Halichoerus grypus]XP_035973646.1 AT-rich interactive domain-containing protein 3B isoform X1 [Halichoerus grypus]
MEPLAQQKQPRQPPPQHGPRLAPLQMDAREKQGQQMREAPFLYAQKLVTQQTLLSATPGRPSGSPALGPLARGPPAAAVARVFERSNVSSEPEEEEGGLEDEDGDDEVAEVAGKEAQAAPKYFHVQKVVRQDPRAASGSGLLPAPGLPLRGQQAKEDHTKDISKAPPSVSTAGQPSWNLDEQLKQEHPISGQSSWLWPGGIVCLDGKNGGLAWSDDADGGRGREISRDFAKLYELDGDPERKEFLDDLFVFMQKRGTPINRIPIMAKQILDLYMLYKLVTEKGGLVEIINKKIWREITKGLNLPTSITSAAFTLRTQYMKYLYAYECEKKALSSPAELQAAIDGNRREGRRPSYSSSLLGYSPAAATAGAPALLSPPKIRFPILGLGSSSGANASSPRVPPATTLRKGDGVPVTTVPVPNRLAVPVALAGQQAGTRTAALEQLRERLESGEPPEKKASRLSEEEQRLVQQAFQRSLFSVARQLPMKIRINGREDRAEASAAALNLAAGSIGSINMSVDIDGTTYAGVLFAQKPVVHLIAGPAPQSLGGSASGSSSSHCSPSPTSSRGTPSAEPSTSWSL